MGSSKWGVVSRVWQVGSGGGARGAVEVLMSNVRQDQDRHGKPHTRLEAWKAAMDLVVEVYRLKFHVFFRPA